MEPKEFWQQLCEEFGYRFFSGIPFLDVEDLYKGMDADVMHYVPAVNEHIALKLSSGAGVSGFKSAVILPGKLVNNLDLEFNIRFNIPVLIITSEEGLNSSNKKIAKKDLKKVKEYIEKNSCPGIFLLN